MSRTPCTLAALIAVTGSALAAGGPFLLDPGAAFERARQERRPLLIDFNATWCEPCEVMERTTWRDVEVLDLLRGFVPLSVDGDRHSNLAARYDVESYPTIVVAAPGGEPVLILTGLQDPAAMRHHLGEVLGAWSDLSRWVVDSGRRNGPPDSTLRLAGFALAHGAQTQAEQLYRRLLRSEKKLPVELALETRLGLVTVLTRTSRCREALRVLRKADASEFPALAARSDELEAGATNCASGP